MGDYIPIGYLLKVDINQTC